MARYAIAALVFVALAAGVWWFLVSDTTPTTTPPVAAPPISTTTPPSSSTSRPATTTTDSHVVETVEEAEAILRELWFGWFEGIYNQDEDRIREVVATEDQVDRAREQFGILEFDSPPTHGAIALEFVELLRSDSECLAVWASASSTFRAGSIEAVHVVRRVESRWVLLSLWNSAEDLWEPECDVSFASS